MTKQRERTRNVAIFGNSTNDAQIQIRHAMLERAQAYPENQKSKLQTLQKKRGGDEILNIFKLIIYHWNLNEALTYYKKEKFCHLYCIAENDSKFGCTRANQCEFQHSYSLKNMLSIDKPSSVNVDDPKFKFGTILLKYLLCTNQHDTNAMLNLEYAMFLQFTGETQAEFESAENYFRKSIQNDNEVFQTHCNYAMLLDEKLDNFHKAEIHYKTALKINPRDFQTTLSLAVLYIKQEKYQEGLNYCNAARILNSNDCIVPFWQATVYQTQNKYEPAIQSYKLALRLHNTNRFRKGYRGLDDDLKDVAEEELANLTSILEKRTKIVSVLKTDMGMSQTVISKYNFDNDITKKWRDKNFDSFFEHLLECRPRDQSAQSILKFLTDFYIDNNKYENTLNYLKLHGHTMESEIRYEFQTLIEAANPKLMENDQDIDRESPFFFNFEFFDRQFREYDDQLNDEFDDYKHDHHAIDKQNDKKKQDSKIILNTIAQEAFLIQRLEMEKRKIQV